MNQYAIAFDVGGLFIKSAVLNQHGEVVPDSYAIFPAKSKASKREIIDHFVFIIKQQTNRIFDRNFEIMGIGYAFPGPFDYEKGISLIKGVDKFETLYGVNLRTELLNQLQADPLFQSKINQDFYIAFDNDANLFALGEHLAGKGRPYKKAMYITVGTGTGSAFMDNGRLVVKRADVPENGWIYNQPFGGSIVDDYISKRGILKLAEELGIDTWDGEVKTIADEAKAGNERAKVVFQQFGRNLGKAIQPHIDAFRPEAVILGGQIVKSKDLFICGMKEILGNQVTIEFTTDTSLSTFVGVAKLLQQAAKE